MGGGRQGYVWQRRFQLRQVALRVIWGPGTEAGEPAVRVGDFSFDEEQMRSATEWLEEGKKKDLRQEKESLSISYTTIESSSRFFMAEGYHQKYW